MTMSDQAKMSPVSVSIDNPDDWADIAQQLSASAGVPSCLTPDVLMGTVGSAVPMLFAADASGTTDLLRDAFAPQVIVQRQRLSGSLNGDTPDSVVLHLVGTPIQDGKTELRVHLLIKTHTSAGGEGASSQFWDFAVGAQVTVGRTSCPNCGAPLGNGQLICDHCHANVGRTVDAPLVVNRLELY
jgi:hypothetical protein